MTEPRIVYAVTWTGDDDSDHVVALFEREEDAKAARDAGVGSDVAPFRVFPAGVLPQRVPFWRAVANVTAAGEYAGTSKAPHVWAREGWEGVDPDVPDAVRVDVEEQPERRGFRYQVVGSARSEDAAVKACSDAVAKLRTEILEREALKPKPGQKPNQEGRRG